MNLSSAILLVNKSIRAIETVYEVEDPNNGKPKARTVYKTLDTTIKPGDLVVIPTDTRYKMSVVKVTATDVEIDFDSPVELKWVVSKLDRSAYDTTLSMEQKAIDMIRSAETRKKREALAEALLKDNPGLTTLLEAPAPKLTD